MSAKRRLRRLLQSRRSAFAKERVAQGIADMMNERTRIAQLVALVAKRVHRDGHGILQLARTAIAFMSLLVSTGMALTVSDLCG